MAEEQDNSSVMESDLDIAAKQWEKELTSEDGEELPEDEDNQLTQDEPEEEEEFLDDGSEEEEAEDEEYETDEEEEPEDDVFEVKSDGKTHQVTLQELKDSFSKGQNYTRKSQALATERSELENAQAEARQAREQAIQALEFAQQQQPQTPEQTDEYWANLKETDPVQFLVEREGLRDVQNKNAEKQHQLGLLKKEQERERSEQLGKYIEGEQEKLLDVIPEWKDSKLADKEKKLVVKFGLKQGFTQTELDQAYDSRAVATMRKAALWDQLQEKRKGIKPVKRTSMKPGSKSGDPRKVGKGKAMDKLRKSGRVEDAAGVFYNMIRSK